MFLVEIRKESIMSSLVIETSPNAVGGYLTNVGNAVRSLLAALLAVKPRQAKVVTAAIETRKETVRAKARNLAQLYRMANQYDSVMPNLAAELRSVASRA